MPTEKDMIWSEKERARGLLGTSRTEAQEVGRTLLRVLGLLDLAVVALDPLELANDRVCLWVDALRFQVDYC